MIHRSNGRQAREDNPQLMIRLKSMTVNVLDLIVSMGKLFELDFRNWRQAMVAGLAWSSLALVLVLGAIPLLGHSAALWLQAGTGMTLAAALAIVAGCTLLAGGIFAWVAWRALHRSVAAFDNSRAEMKQNFAWLRGQMTTSDAAHWDGEFDEPDDEY